MLGAGEETRLPSSSSAFPAAAWPLRLVRPDPEAEAMLAEKDQFNAIANSWTCRVQELSCDLSEMLMIVDATPTGSPHLGHKRVRSYLGSSGGQK